MEILLLSDSQVKPLLKAEEVIEAVEMVFMEKAKGRVQMPSKTYVFIKKHEGDLRAMPSYIETLDACGVKIVNVHPNNPIRYNLPAIAAVVLLIDPKTGLPLSIMGGTWITALRTGAAGAVATKYLAKRDSSILSLVGAGVQATTQLMMISKILALKQVRVWDIRPERTQQLVDDSRKRYDFAFVACKTAEECVKGADVICTTTPATSPVVKNDWLEAGQHINAIGADAPGKQELDPEILKRAKIVIDDWDQASHSGEINVPFSLGIIGKEDVYGELGEIVAGLKKGRASDEEITVFDSTGLSIQDIATATIAYKKAKAENIGESFSF
ncbi:MAG: alanine dehydrogenase [archaeon]